MTQPPSPDQPPLPSGVAPQPSGAPPQAHDGMPPAVPQPQAYGTPPQAYGTQPQPYGAPAQTYGTPAQAYGAPPQPYGGQPQPYGTPAQPYGTQPQPYGAPAQPYGAPLAHPGAAPALPATHAYVGTPPGAPPVEPAPTHPGGAIGGVQHNAYGPWGASDEAPPPELPSGRSKRPSGWNGPAFGLLAIAIAILGVVVWPQIRARQTENQARPLVQALSQRDASARCPRYITSVLTNVGSVSLDESGGIADRTDLTGPVCDGLRHLYADGGKAELSCLTGSGTCPESARRSVVALSVVVHESMHLRGQLDEGRAECESIGESATLSTSLGIPLEQARMISWLHYAAMNPYTPPEYQITASDCQFVAELEAEPPGSPGAREALRAQISATWSELAS